MSLTDEELDVLRTLTEATRELAEAVDSLVDSVDEGGISFEPDFPLNDDGRIDVGCLREMPSV